MAESTLGGGLNAPGAYVEYEIHFAVVLHHHAEAAVVVLASTRSHAIDDFLLQHKVHVFHDVSKRHQMENQRRGDVVGQVANNTQLLITLTEAGEIKVQGIRFTEW